ncbi:hypothetical protein F4782DRAFT_552030 [Xylaria castorea]|nr:hypothetical protein F4782DRAFT_552030 [Xylaria castorea]
MKKNLSKSIKLEIAGAKLFSLDLDLVNLRKEVYEVGSRTPKMKFEILEENTFRRDATVNAPFFNLHSRKALNPTKTGLEEMATCIIRTPLDPRQTFLDDLGTSPAVRSEPLYPSLP